LQNFNSILVNKRCINAGTRHALAKDKRGKAKHLIVFSYNLALTFFADNPAFYTSVQIIYDG